MQLERRVGTAGSAGKFVGHLAGHGIANGGENFNLKEELFTVAGDIGQSALYSVGNGASGVILGKAAGAVVSTGEKIVSPGFRVAANALARNPFKGKLWSEATTKLSQAGGGLLKNMAGGAVRGGITEAPAAFVDTTAAYHGIYGQEAFDPGGRLQAEGMSRNSLWWKAMSVRLGCAMSGGALGHGFQPIRGSIDKAFKPTFGLEPLKWSANSSSAANAMGITKQLASNGVKNLVAAPVSTVARVGLKGATNAAEFGTDAYLSLYTDAVIRGWYGEENGMANQKQTEQQLVSSLAGHIAGRLHQPGLDLHMKYKQQIAAQHAEKLQLGTNSQASDVGVKEGKKIVTAVGSNYDVYAQSDQAAKTQTGYNLGSREGMAAHRAALQEHKVRGEAAQHIDQQLGGEVSKLATESAAQVSAVLRANDNGLSRTFGLKDDRLSGVEYLHSEMNRRAAGLAVLGETPKDPLKQVEHGERLADHVKRYNNELNGNPEVKHKGYLDWLFSKVDRIIWPFGDQHSDLQIRDKVAPKDRSLISWAIAPTEIPYVGPLVKKFQGLISNVANAASGVGIALVSRPDPSPDGSWGTIVGSWYVGGITAFHVGRAALLTGGAACLSVYRAVGFDKTYGLYNRGSGKGAGIMLARVQEGEVLIGQSKLHLENLQAKKDPHSSAYRQMRVNGEEKFGVDFHSSLTKDQHWKSLPEVLKKSIESGNEKISRLQSSKDNPNPAIKATKEDYEVWIKAEKDRVDNLILISQKLHTAEFRAEFDKFYDSIQPLKKIAGEHEVRVKEYQQIHTRLNREVEQAKRLFDKANRRHGGLIGAGIRTFEWMGDGIVSRALPRNKEPGIESLENSTSTRGQNYGRIFSEKSLQGLRGATRGLMDSAATLGVRNMISDAASEFRYSLSSWKSTPESFRKYSNALLRVDSEVATARREALRDSMEAQINTRLADPQIKDSDRKKFALYREILGDLEDPIVALTKADSTLTRAEKDALIQTVVDRSKKSLEFGQSESFAREMLSGLMGSEVKTVKGEKVVTPILTEAKRASIASEFSKVIDVKLAETGLRKQYRESLEKLKTDLNENKGENKLIFKAPESKISWIQSERRVRLILEKLEPRLQALARSLATADQASKTQIRDQIYQAIREEIAKNPMAVSGRAIKAITESVHETLLVERRMGQILGSKILDTPEGVKLMASLLDSNDGNHKRAKRVMRGLLESMVELDFDPKDKGGLLIKALTTDPADGLTNPLLLQIATAWKDGSMPKSTLVEHSEIANGHLKTEESIRFSRLLANKLKIEESLSNTSANLTSEQLASLREVIKFEDKTYKAALPPDDPFSVFSLRFNRRANIGKTFEELLATFDPKKPVPGGLLEFLTNLAADYGNGISRRMVANGIDKLRKENDKLNEELSNIGRIAYLKSFFVETAQKRKIARNLVIMQRLEDLLVSFAEKK